MGAYLWVAAVCWSRYAQTQPACTDTSAHSIGLNWWPDSEEGLPVESHQSINQERRQRMLATLVMTQDHRRQRRLRSRSCAGSPKAFAETKGLCTPR